MDLQAASHPLSTSLSPSPLLSLGTLSCSYYACCGPMFDGGPCFRHTEDKRIDRGGRAAGATTGTQWVPHQLGNPAAAAFFSTCQIMLTLRSEAATVPLVRTLGGPCARRRDTAPPPLNELLCAHVLFGFLSGIFSSRKPRKNLSCMKY